MSSGHCIHWKRRAASSTGNEPRRVEIFARTLGVTTISTNRSGLGKQALSKARAVIARRPCDHHAVWQALGGPRHIYREVLFELVEGRPATPLFQALVADPSSRARLQAVLLSNDAVSVLFDLAGSALAMARVREALVSGAQPALLSSDIVMDTERHLRFIVTWRRPRDHAKEGVSLEHILLDTVGPGGLLFGRVENGVIAYKAASPGGRGLSEFLAEAQRAFGGRYRVRALRAGPFKSGWEIDDSPKRVDPDEEALLSAALANGYYDDPKRCGVRELGDALGVSKSVVARRLRDLERRALERMVS